MKRFLNATILALILTVLHGAAWWIGVVEPAELWLVDRWFAVRGPVTVPANVLVVGMEDSSYKWLNLDRSQPWPREVHARLVSKLADLGAKGVVFDILFVGPGRSEAANRELKESFGRLPVIIGTARTRFEQPEAVVTSNLAPLPEIAEAAHAVGNVNMPEDAGYVRRFPETESLSDLGAEILLGKAPSPPSRRAMINFFGPAATVQSYPYYSVLDPDQPLPAELVRGKVVFVGLMSQASTGPAEKDTYLTPYPGRGRTAGVEIHATAAANLASGRWIDRLPYGVELAVVSALLFGTTVLALLLSPVAGLIAMLTAALAWATVSYLLFLLGTFLPGVVAIGLVLPFAYLLGTLGNYVAVRRRQEKIRRAFEFYLSPAMAKEVAQDPNALKLGGEEVVATAFFTDIAGFTSISESMDPQRTAAMLNSYFSDVANVILERNGTLIKFIGDGIFALWGAPKKTADHASLACTAAQLFRARNDEFNRAGHFPLLHTRIGVHTGPMLVGNLGSNVRFDFTAIGDSVNLAARIEGINKYLGTTILISEATFQAIGGPPDWLEVGSVRVVGRSQPISLYTIFAQDLTNEERQRWQSCLEAFQERSWDDAAAGFSSFLTVVPLSKAAQYYLDTIAHLRVNPPAHNWSGELVFSSK